jgi:O-antigen/teichoic acid export membrane protein
MEPWMLIMAGIYCLVCPATQMFQLNSQIHYKYKLSVAVTMISLLTSVFISLLMVLVLNNRIVGRIVGYYTPLIIINIVLYAYILFRSKGIHTKYWKYALTISFPLIWHTLANNLLSSSDRIMITKYCGASDTALYSVIYSCASVMSILWGSMNTAWSPWAYEKMDLKEYEDLKKASRPYIIFFMYATLMFLLIGPELILVMGGKAYIEAINVLPPVVVGFVFQFIYSLYVNIEFYHKKQKIIAFATIISAIVNLGLNAIFIPKFGFVAAACTTLVGYVVLFLIHFTNVRRMNKTYWYDTKFNFGAILVSLIMLIGTAIIYQNRAARLTVLFVVSLVSFISMYLYRKKLVPIIKEFIK